MQLKIKASRYVKNFLVRVAGIRHLLRSYVFAHLAADRAEILKKGDRLTPRCHYVTLSHPLPAREGGRRVPGLVRFAPQVAARDLGKLHGFPGRIDRLHSHHHICKMISFMTSN